MLKDLLVLLDARSQRVGPYALSLAALCGAHVTGVAPALDPTLSRYAFVETPPEVWITAGKQAEKAARRLLGGFVEEAQRAGVAADMLILKALRGTTEWEFGHLARHFDLTLVEQANPDTANAQNAQNAMIEAALFDSGRPVLVVPYIHSKPAAFDTILVAWDGGAPAARALGDALPFLRRAGRVDLVTVADDGGSEPERAGAGIARHLVRHGINTGLRRLTSAGDVANTLLSHIADTGADLLVMGGYGHSRLREIVLGGTTREILASMTVPVLMAH